MRALLVLAAIAAVPAAAEDAVPVAVLVHAVPARTRLVEADFTTAQLSPAEARGTLAAIAAVGKETTRPLAAGSPVRSYDLAEPPLVRRGQTVTLLIEDGALRISGRGRALATGARGAIVRAQLQGATTLVEGEVVDAGVIRIGG